MRAEDGNENEYDDDDVHDDDDDDDDWRVVDTSGC